MVRCLRGRGSGRGRGRGREGGAGSACGVRQQRVEGERASRQGGLWGWQWVGAAVVAEVGEEVEAVVAREWKQGLAGAVGKGEVLSTGPGAVVICMLPWALVQQSSYQAGVVRICAERGGGQSREARANGSQKPGE